MKGYHNYSVQEVYEKLIEFLENSTTQDLGEAIELFKLEEGKKFDNEMEDSSVTKEELANHIDNIMGNYRPQVLNSVERFLEEVSH